MNTEKFTNASTQLIQEAFNLAKQEQHSMFQTVHILAASLKTDYCVACYKELNIDDIFCHDNLSFYCLIYNSVTHPFFIVNCLLLSLKD